jgi:pimeloyl-ACP methyl ester carboxylesterase
MNPATAAPSRDNRTTVRTSRPAPLSLRVMGAGLQVLSHVSPSGAAAVAEHLFLTPRRRPRPASENDILETAYPFTIASKHGDLAAWAWGDDNGPRVLLVHGWEGRGAQLGPLVEPLTSLGFRVVTFDAPAHGDSPGERSSLVHFADGVAGAARALGPLHGIVAHSMGGPAALWASRSRRLAARVVLVAPPLDIRDFTRAVSSVLGLPEEVRERGHARREARFGVGVEALRSDRLASAMRGPALVLHDQDDREVSIACGEAIARAWPGSTLVRTQGLGHRRILRDAAAIGTVTRFLAPGVTGG